MISFSDIANNYKYLYIESHNFKACVLPIYNQQLYLIHIASEPDSLLFGIQSSKPSDEDNPSNLSQQDEWYSPDKYLRWHKYMQYSISQA